MTPDIETWIKTVKFKPHITTYTHTLTSLHTINKEYSKMCLNGLIKFLLSNILCSLSIGLRYLNIRNKFCGWNYLKIRYLLSSFQLIVEENSIFSVETFDQSLWTQFFNWIAVINNTIYHYYYQNVHCGINCWIAAVIYSELISI